MRAMLNVTINGIRIIKMHNDPLRASLHSFTGESGWRERARIRKDAREEIVSKKSRSMRNPLTPTFFPRGRFDPHFVSTCNGIATRRVVSTNVELYNYWHLKRRGRYRDARHRPTNKWIRTRVSA